MFTVWAHFFHIHNNIYPPLPKLVWTQALVWPYDLAPPLPPSSLPPLPTVYLSHWKGVEGAKEKNGTANKKKKHFKRQSVANY